MARRAVSLAALAAVCLAVPIHASDPSPRANYKLAIKFSRDNLRRLVHSTEVRPRWIGESDRFYYRYDTSAGHRYMLVDPERRQKTRLFDHDRLAALLSEALRKPQDGNLLDLDDLEVDDAGEWMSFRIEDERFRYHLERETLEPVEGETTEQATRSSSPPDGRSRSGSRSRRDDRPGSHRNFAPDRTAYVFCRGHDLYYVEADEETKARIREITERMEKEKEEKQAGEKSKAGGTHPRFTMGTQGDGTKTSAVEGEKQHGGKQDEGKQGGLEKAKQGTNRNRTEEGGEGDGSDEGGEKNDGLQTDSDIGKKTDRDRTREKTTDKRREGDEEKSGETGDESEKKDDRDERERWADEVDETKALRLSDDGEKDFSFARRSRGRSSDGEKDEEDDENRLSRPSVTWSEDSQAFYVTRTDQRGVAELYLVDSLAEPRPRLETYKYPMPGEEHIRRSELRFFHRAEKTLHKLEPKWVDEGYQSIHFGKTGDELRAIRRDRLLRNVELCAVDVHTLETRALIEEGFEAANVATQTPRYLEKRDDMIWWSERSGWGHYYLYGRDGAFRNVITPGTFRASRIVDVDEEKGLLYFRGNGREKGENVYYEHLYRVYLDGTGLALMDPGDAFHRSELSPSKKFLVDNYSRVDLAPVSVLRDAGGNQVLELEVADLSQLYATGWKMPETFVVKAADGVTDLYGNMWKPFNFDPNRKYPIIANVYPGPQTEGVSHTFSATRSQQQLAQIGFIVIQVGHRGGTPGRSKAYHSFGYFNLRDYGLEDKKFAIEQLADRYPFIDIGRVGIYGHSGGGFMSAAAMLKPPYNDFFKVAVASAGNHDNNIYNNMWSERYHGLKVVPIEKGAKSKSDSDQKSSRREGDRESTGASRGEGDAEEDRDGQKDGDVDRREERDEEQEDEEQEGDADEKKVRFEIRVPTNAELAANLKGRLLLVHGEMDNNVHPANTMRLADALIKANKRFDMLILPGKRHGFGDYQTYFNHVMWEYFAKHLLGDRQTGADILEKDG